MDGFGAQVFQRNEKKKIMTSTGVYEDIYIVVCAFTI